MIDQYESASGAPRVRNDFDAIARLVEAEGLADSPQRYERELLSFVPTPCRFALDVGCGTGSFTRELAERAARVIAIDLSAEMIRVAKERSAAQSNIDFMVADLRTWTPPPGPIDAIVSIATLHHLPLAETLLHIGGWLRPGGTLIVHDLITNWGGVRGVVKNALAATRLLARQLHPSRRRSAALRQAWKAHGGTETYHTIDQIRGVYRATLPGARILEHLEWRYTAIWRRPDSP